jgi:uracil-DNA glycosylase family 4
MSPYVKLALFGLKQVLGGIVYESVATAAKFVEERFADPSQKLPRALAKANDQAWKTLSIALAGEGWFDQLKNWFAAGDEKALAEQIRVFLKRNAFCFDGATAPFRKKCLAELNAVRQAGLLSAGNLAMEMTQQFAGFQRYANREGMIQEAQQVVGGIADALVDYPNLARLLRQPTGDGPPLLVAAFAYFFRREIETDSQLAHGLFWDGLRELSAAQEQAFEEVGKSLTTFGDRFDEVFDQLARIEEAVVEIKAVAGATHGAVLDLQAEMQRLASLHLTNTEDIRRLMLEVLNRVSETGMQKGEVKPQHSFSIRSEDERSAVKHLLASFRKMPAEEQKQFPALLNGLGKLQIGSGDFEGARKTFDAVAENTTEASAQAEAHFNAYRAALEQKKWDEALAEIQKAASLDAQRFAPFPLQRYQVKRILGAGGFGTAFLCQDRFFNAEVVVKTLHDSGLERDINEVFREAQVLGQLHHPAIIGVRDCTYADLGGFVRPYIVMDYFPGDSLENFIQYYGTLSAEALIDVAKQIAEGMQAAHEKNILHRDLKPANVLVHEEDNQWQAKIIDFGLALRKEALDTSIAPASDGTTAHSLAGTLKYAPPEQLGELKGVKPGPYSDVYSFGKLCCYALFKTTEPKDRHWKEVAEERPWQDRRGKQADKDLKEMLEQCREDELKHRLKGFDQVLKSLKPYFFHNRGKAWFENEQFEKAIQDFDQAIRMKPDVALFYNGRALAWSKVDIDLREPEMDEMEEEEYEKAMLAYDEAIGKPFEEAMRNHNEAIRLEPNNPSWYISRAECFKASRKHEAIQDYNHAIGLEPNNPSLYIQRARFYGHVTKDYEKAIQDYDQAIVLEPNNPSLYIQRAVFYRNLGRDVAKDREKAIQDYGQAIALEPNNPSLYIERAVFYRDVTKDYEKAMQDHDQAIRLDPNNPVWYQRRGYFYLRANKDYEKALQDYDQAIRLNPEDEDNYFGRAKIWRLKKDHDREIADLNEVIRKRPGDDSLFRKRARAWCSKGDYQKAIEDYGEAIHLLSKENSENNAKRMIVVATSRQWPDTAKDVLALNFVERADLWSIQQEFEKAIRDLDQAILLDDHGAPSYLCKRGRNWLALQNRATAIKDFETAARGFEETIRKSPNKLIALVSLARLLSTCPEEKIRNGNRAIQLATQACELCAKLPAWKDTPPIDTLAAAYAEAGQFEEAIRLLKLALENPSRSAWTKDKYRQRLELYQQKKPYRESLPQDQALSDFDEAIRLEPNEAQPYAERGALYYLRGNFDQAIADCTQAIRFGPKNPDLYFVRGASFHQKGNLERAICDLTEAVRLDPNREEFKEQLGVAKEAIEDSKRNSDLQARPREGESSKWESLEHGRKALELLAQEVSVCCKCSELVSSRNQTVFGEGAPGVELCFVGEAPGADEDAQGLPFVGAAGQLLNKIIAACGFERSEVYICNIIKCRPPGNRTPLPNEAANCRAFLERQLELVQPRFICALGSCAAQNLLNSTLALGKLRGRFHHYKGIPVLCTYHPAYLLPHRNPDKKKDVWEDMKILLTRMGRPIPLK